MVEADKYWEEKADGSENSPPKDEVKKSQILIWK